MLILVCAGSSVWAQSITHNAIAPTTVDNPANWTPSPSRVEGAPDIVNAGLRMTVGDISGVLWNHSYAMQDRMRAVGIPFPRFQGNEMADIISYLHLLGYRGQGGDSDKGAAVFRAKGCAVCHEYQRVQAPDLSDLHADDDAIGLVAAMWNHAPEMHEVMAEHGMPWPQFNGSDMEDLVAYLRGIP